MFCVAVNVMYNINNSNRLERLAEHSNIELPLGAKLLEIALGYHEAKLSEFQKSMMHDKVHIPKVHLRSPSFYFLDPPLPQTSKINVCDREQ